MKQNYKLTYKYLDSTSDIIAYKKNLKDIWNNNVYYSVEHLKHFDKETEKLCCFLFLRHDVPIILMPIIYRSIKINGKITPYYDVISPYGYSGPLYNNDTVSKEDIAFFWTEVDKWYRENNVVTEFIRFSLN